MSPSGLVCLGGGADLFSVLGGHAQAEYYVAGQIGVNFADRLKNIEGTGSLLNQRAPDFDLKNSVSYGGKLGYFPGTVRWVLSWTYSIVNRTSRISMMFPAFTSGSRTSG